MNEKDLNESVKRFNFLNGYKPENAETLEQYNVKLLVEEHNSLLNEDLSISEHVKIVSRKIERLITKNPNKPYHKLTDYDFIGELEIITYATNCRTQKDADKSYKNCSINLAHAVLQNNQLFDVRLTVYIILLNGNIIKNELYPIIFHEVENAYQEYEKLLTDYSNNGQINTHPKKRKIKRNNLYNFAIKNLNHSNKYIKDLCWIYYMSDLEEQDAFVNKLYKYMTSTKGLDLNNFNSIYETSQAYKILIYLIDIQKTIDEWSDNKILFNNMLQFFKQNGMDFEIQKTKDLLEYTINRFMGKIGKILIKVKKDKYLIEFKWKINLRIDTPF